MPSPDPFPNDPFFKRGPSSEWNACIGRQGNELNYLDGYIEAAIEMVRALFTRKLMGQRDTLVLPTLYNARHGLELALKFSTKQLMAAGLLKHDGTYKANHNIKALWQRLHDAGLGDTKLVTTIASLQPFIASLSGIDEDGQELRYHENRDNDKSLDKYALANLEVIQASLVTLKDLIDDLKYRTMDYIDEAVYGIVTKTCSRADLLAIAKALPARDQWRTDAFTEARDTNRNDYGLGSGQFQKATDAILKNRELSGLIGIETPLLHVTDDEVVRTVQRWRRLHPPRAYDPHHLGIEALDPKRYEGAAFEEMRNRHALEEEVNAEIRADLSPEAVAEVEAMFYFGRDGGYAEEHEDRVAAVLKEHSAANDPRQKIDHLIEKTNLLQNLRRAAPKLGRLDLGRRLDALDVPAPQAEAAPATGE